MKKLIITSVIALATAFWGTAQTQEYPQEYLGLPGDNLNLYAVMKLFQESETLEGFERTLNDENSHINNLDLNGDNLVDYIMVNDYIDGDVHNIVLRVAVNKKETQDVAVFTVQRSNDGSTQIQLIGDEELYGKNYIVEPINDNLNGETPNPGYSGRYENGRRTDVVRTTYVEVAGWPLIRFLFMPGYHSWHSSWYWGYYPSYWNPWRPSYWHYYYGYHYQWFPQYYRQYRLCDQMRYSRYNDFYYRSVRVHSPQVNIFIGRGNYRNTYSHPEQRREGEVLFSRTHPDRAREISNNRSYGSPERNSFNRSEREMGNTGTRYGTERRTPTTINRNSVGNRDIRSNGGVSRGSGSENIERKAPYSPSGQGTGIYRRPSSDFRGEVSTKSAENRSAATYNRTPSVNSGRNYERNTSTVNSARRPAEVNSGRTYSSPSSDRQSMYTRKSTPVNTEKAVARPSTGREQVSSMKSGKISTDKVYSKPSPGRTYSPSRRSSEVSHEREVTRSSSVQKNSTDNRSGGSSQKGTRTTDTEHSRSSRR
jgi:hypothetical protein